MGTGMMCFFSVTGTVVMLVVLAVCAMLTLVFVGLVFWVDVVGPGPPAYFVGVWTNLSTHSHCNCADNRKTSG